MQAHNEGPSEGYQLKRKSIQNLDLPISASPEQQAAQAKQQRVEIGNPAQIDLTPGGFLEVTVHKEHCSRIASGCGFHTDVILKTLKEDNDKRKIAIQSNTEVPHEDEADNPMVNLDTGSEDESDVEGAAI